MKASRVHRRLVLAVLTAFLLVLGTSSTASASGTGPSFASWSADTTAPRTSDTITFTGSGSDADGGNIASYQWDFNGDGSYDTAALQNADVTHQFTTPGTYNVILKVTDDDDGLSYVSHAQQITVKGNWAPEFVSVAPEGTSQYPRTGQQVTFDFYADDPDGGPGNAANANLDWKIDWDGDGSVDQTVAATGFATPISHVYASAGDYVVHYSATDRDGNITYPNRTANGIPLRLVVAGNQPPASSQTSWNADVASATVGQSVQFTGYSADSDGGNIASYEWDFNGDGAYDTAPSASNVVDHTFASPGTYNVSVRVTDDDPAGGTGPGATQTYTNQFEVSAPNGAFGYMYDNYGYYGSAKTGQPLDFYALAYNLPSGVTVTNYSFRWDDGSADTNTALPQAQHTYASAGDYRPRTVMELSDGTTLTVQYAAYDGYYYADPYSFTYGYVPLRVRANHAPVQAYALPVNNSGCMHAGVSLPFALYGIDPDGGHIATFDVDWNSDGVFDSTGVPASDATSNTANVNHTFALPGTYYITVRAHDDDGGATFTDVYTVQTVVIADTNCLPYPQITNSPDQPQTGHAITFDASYSSDLDGSVTNYQWDWDQNGTYDSTGASATHAFGTDGDHYFTLKVTDNDGGVSYTDGMVTTHTGNHLPVFFGLFISPTFADTTDAVYFDASGYDDDGNIASYGWDWNGDGVVDNTTSSPAAQHVYAAAGTYQPRVTLIDNDGGSVTSPADTYPVTVTQAQPSATVSWTPQEPHPGNSISFSAHASSPNGAINQYTWHWGDGTADTVTTVPNANHAYASQGSYPVSVTVRDTTSATGSGLAQNVVVKTNWPPHAFFAVSPSCATPSTSMTFDASGTTDSDSAIATYHWTFGDGTTADTNGPTTTHSYSGANVYNATLTATDAGGATSSQFQQAVYVQATNCPPQDVYYNYSPNSLPSGTPITFTGHARDFDGTIASYTWNWGDGTANTISPTSGGNDTHHTFASPGQYFVQVTARDNNGATAQYGQYLLVGVDTTPPTVTLTTPADGATTSAAPSYSGTAGNDVSDSGSVTVKVYSGSSVNPANLVQTRIATRSGASWQITGSPTLPAGTYTAQAQQSDAAANVGFSAPHTFMVDGTPPSVSLTTPANGSSTNDTTPTFSGIGGTASGDQATVTVTIYSGSNSGGSVVQTLPSTRNGATGAYSIDAAALAPGTYTAQASQQDTAGNIGTSTANTFTLDTTAPAVTLTAPANGASTNDATPSYSGAAGNASGDSTSVTVKIYAGSSAGGSPVQTRLATRSGPIWTIDGSPALGDGTYTAQATQTDAAGNTGTSSADTFVIDTAAPTVSLTAPSGGNATNDTTPTYSGAAGTATGDSTSVTVNIYSGSSASGSPVQSRVATRSGGTWTIDGSPALAAGTYTAQATQTDTAGNTGTSAPATFVIDTTVPSITLTSPANGSTSQNSTPTFSGTAGAASRDGVSVTVNVYGGSNTSGTVLQSLSTTRDNVTGAYSVSASAALPDGTYTAQASQGDSAGNTGTSSANTFTINGPPVVTLTSPADGAVLGTHTLAVSGGRGQAAGDLPTVTVKIYAGTSASGSAIQTLTDPGTGATWTVSPASLADGTYTAQASQSDGALTGTSPAHTFTIDTTAPAVTLTTPASGSSTNDTTPTYSGAAGNAIGDSASVTVKIYSGSSVAGSPVQTRTATRTGNAWTIDGSPALGDGTYTAQATQTDNATPANSGTSTARTFIVDTTSPTVTLASPSSAARTTDTTPTLSGTGSTALGDTSSVTVKIYAGSGTAGSVLQTLTPPLAGGNYSVDAAVVADGTYTAQASQSDQAGNTGTSAANTFTVDTTAPGLTLTTPANGSSTNDSTPAYGGASGNATGDSSSVTVKIYSGSSAVGSPVQTRVATRSGNTWTIDGAPALADGTYTAQATQVDDLGNTATTAGRTFKVDTVAPVVTLTAPADASSSTNSTPTFNGVAGAAVGDSATVTVNVYGGSAASGSPVQTLNTTGSGGAWSVAASALAAGAYTAQAQQSDDAGNTGKSASVTFTIAAQQPPPPPATNQLPVCDNGSAIVDNGSAKRINLSCSDADSDVLRLTIVSGPAHGTLSVIDQGSASVTYTPTGTYSGSDSFTFEANDGKGDSNVATMSITVAALPPDKLGKMLKLPPPGIVKVVLSGKTPASANFGNGICPPACFIVINLTPAKGKASLGTGKFNVPVGKSVPLKVKLTKKGSAELKKKGSLKITCQMVVKDAAGRATTIKRNYTLKAKKN